MSKLRLGPLFDDKPVKRTITLSASLNADLKAYADLIAAETGQVAPSIEKMIPLMLERFVRSDREFVKLRRKNNVLSAKDTADSVQLERGV